MPGKQYDPEFKRNVAREVATGLKRPAQACREYGISDSVLHRWRQRYAREGDAAWSTPASDPTTAREQRVADLERLVGQLALENAVLKNLAGCTIREKHAMIAVVQDSCPTLSIRQLCVLLSVNRAW